MNKDLIELEIEKSQWHYSVRTWKNILFTSQNIPVIFFLSYEIQHMQTFLSSPLLSPPIISSHLISLKQTDSAFTLPTKVYFYIFLTLSLISPFPSSFSHTHSLLFLTLTLIPPFLLSIHTQVCNVWERKAPLYLKEVWALLHQKSLRSWNT